MVKLSYCGNVSFAPSFPSCENGEALHDTDETVWTEKTFPCIETPKTEFVARTETEAVEIVLVEIEAFYQHVLI